MAIYEIRRANLKLLAAQQGSQAALSRATGKAPAYIGQLVSGIRNLGEAASRDIEKALGLPRDWLDHPRTDKETPAAFPAETWDQLSPEARTLVLTVAEFSAFATNSGEAALLAAYRSCSKDSRAVILSVAQAQAGQSRKGRR